MTYTLQDLEDARVEAKRWSDLIANDSSNNPDKHQSDSRMAHEEVRHITECLKRDGVIPYTDKELLYQELDQEFPDAQSRDIVEHKGAKYQRRFSPGRMSRSRKNVMRWNKWWVKLDS